MTGLRLAAAALLACAVAASVPARAQGGGMQQYAIVDPVLQMRAWTLSIPAGWHAEGTMMPGSSCNSSTTPIFRATGPGGTTGAYFLPRADWTWGAGARAANDCLPWRSRVSAKDFLAYQMRIDKVGFVRQEPAPPTGALPPGFSSESARYLVRYGVKGRLYDELLSDTVTCRDADVMGVGVTHSCSALVTRWYAPSGRLETMMPTFNAMHLALNQQWMSAWTAAMVNRTQRLYQSQTEALLAQGRLAQAQRMQAHQAFMSSFQHGADVRNQRFAAGQYQKQRNNDNFVDYILDCQRAYSGNTRVSGGNCPNRQTF